MIEKQENRTHRCTGCEQAVEHFQDEMCSSCGRCPKHCLCKAA